MAVRRPRQQQAAAGRRGWSESYFRGIGLAELAEEGFARIGTRVRPMGEPVGQGLTEASAAALGLCAGTAVSVSIIDAHAGGLGLLGLRAPPPPASSGGDGGDQGNSCQTSEEGSGGESKEGDTAAAAAAGGGSGAPSLCRRLALIGGTSSCHMALSSQPLFVPGVWGPYYSAMVPGLWLTEGGQSATGSLIDHVITTHACYPGIMKQLAAEAEGTGGQCITVYQHLNSILDQMAADNDGTATAADAGLCLAKLCSEYHVFPDFHGNRSPRADATLRGMICGLSLNDNSPQALARLYLATVQAVAHGSRHILDTMNRNGHGIETVLVCGGGAKNPLFLQQHADILGCRLLVAGGGGGGESTVAAVPGAAAAAAAAGAESGAAVKLPPVRGSHPVLLGSAILGCVAAAGGPSVTPVPQVMGAMSGDARAVLPNPATAEYHNRKHAVFLRMYHHQMEYRRLMSGAEAAGRTEEGV